jgi:hypothetical protein
MSTSGFVGPRDRVRAGFTARLTAPSPPNRPGVGRGSSRHCLGQSAKKANLLADLVGPRDLVCAGFTARLTAPAYQSGQLSRKARVDSPKSVRIHSKKLTSVSIHFKKCVPICWLILLSQGNLCLQASRLASLPPAHQSGQLSGKLSVTIQLQKMEKAEICPKVLEFTQKNSLVLAFTYKNVCQSTG